MKLQESPGFIIAKLAHRMAVELDKALKKYGVTISQWTILNLLWQKEGLSQVELQQILGLEGATITGLLQRMESGGFVRRSPDLDGRRIQRIYLTEMGRSMEVPLCNEARHVNDKALQNFSPDERDFFMRLLLRALNNFA
jgi:DNA-binding MarR family transcriptional regulator